MCTVSAILGPGVIGRISSERSPSESAPLLRIVCNRDEKRTRTEALPPVCREFGERTAILPIDPLSRGTWIGVNDAGLALCLLNATVRGERGGALPHAGLLRSRGEIIPSLLDCETVSEAIDRAASLESREFPPFRLIAVSRTHVGMVVSQPSRLRVLQLRPMRAPFMATSSSLGDEFVEPIRRELFGELLRESSDIFEAQHRFHSHQWPNRRHMSVLMARPDARTVSRTIVEVRSDSVRMKYRSLAETHSTLSASESMVLPLTSAEVMA